MAFCKKDPLIQKKAASNMQLFLFPLKLQNQTLNAYPSLHYDSVFELSQILTITQSL